MRKNYNGKYCIVRCNRAGVFAGNVESRNGQEVLIKNARRLWRWDGANSISDLAYKGTMNSNECRFTVEVEEIELLEAIEIIPCTKLAEKSIKGVNVWSY